LVRVTVIGNSFADIRLCSLFIHPIENMSDTDSVFPFKSRSKFIICFKFVKRKYFSEIKIDITLYVLSSENNTA